MNRLIFVVSACCCLASTVMAQGLSDQINAVDAVQQREINREFAREQAYRRAVAERQARIEAERRADKRREQEYQDRLRSMDIESGQLDLLEKRQRITSDKQRDQAYEDQLRNLDVEQKKLQLERAKTRAARENEYIDRDLKNQDAHTDVVQSEADSTRAVANGVNNLLTGVGAGETNRNSFFGR